LLVAVIVGSTNTSNVDFDVADSALPAAMAAMVRGAVRAS
jgi:hypothetical protein